jgi:ABC-type spermidine/putrescine transport system permease subunit II
VLGDHLDLAELFKRSKALSFDCLLSVFLSFPHLFHLPYSFPSASRGATLRIFKHQATQQMFTCSSRSRFIFSIFLACSRIFWSCST